MKIAFFTDTFLPSVNGISSYLVNISNALTERGHQIYVIAPKTKEPVHLDNKNIEVIHVPSIPSYFYPDFRLGLFMPPNVLRKMRHVNPDIIHFHAQSFISASGILLAKIINKPLIGTFHTYIMEPEYLSHLGLEKVHLEDSKVVNQIVWSFNNFLYNQANLVISPCDYVKKDLQSHGLKRPVKVVSNGINLRITDTHVKSSLLIPEKYFLYIGRVSTEKSLDVLLKAFDLFLTKGGKSELVIVGDGPEREELEKMCVDMGIDDKVHFMGVIPHSELIGSDLIRNATAFTTASTTEVQPVSLLEAIAFKLPIIGVKSKGVTDFVKKNGIGCRENDINGLARAMLFLETHPKDQKRMSAESFKLAQQHSIESCAQQLEKIYKDLSK
jgi:glycosyltransferase involved in cell wall biosynthesis